MKSLTREQARAWCEQKSLKVANNDYLYFEHERLCIAIELPEKPYTLVAIANALLPDRVPAQFEGALLWLRQWGIWSELVERAGFRVMEAMRGIHGDSRSPEEAPGYLFGAQELVDLQVCFIQPLLIGWDAFLVPESGDYFVATSHDETTCVLSRTREIHKKLLGELQPWNAREDEGWYFRGLDIAADH